MVLATHFPGFFSHIFPYYFNPVVACYIAFLLTNAMECKSFKKKTRYSRKKSLNNDTQQIISSINITTLTPITATSTIRMSFSFSFKTYYNHDARFNINGVQYDVKVSSNMVDEQQGRIMGRQVITLMKNTEGVNMVRKETMMDGGMEGLEFFLTGEGLMENTSEEVLKNFATELEWMRLIQEEGHGQWKDTLLVGCVAQKFQRSS